MGISSIVICLLHTPPEMGSTQPTHLHENTMGISSIVNLSSSHASRDDASPYICTYPSNDIPTVKTTPLKNSLIPLAPNVRYKNKEYLKLGPRLCKAVQTISFWRRERAGLAVSFCCRKWVQTWAEYEHLKDKCWCCSWAKPHNT